MKILRKTIMLFCILYAGDELKFVPLHLPFAYVGECPCHVGDKFEFVEEMQQDPCCSLCILEVDGKRILGADYSGCKCNIKVCPDGAFVKLTSECPEYVAKTYPNGDVSVLRMREGEKIEDIVDLKDPDPFYPVSINSSDALEVRNWEDANAIEEAAKALDAVLQSTGLEWIYRHGYEENIFLPIQLVEENGIKVYDLHDKAIKPPFVLRYLVMQTIIHEKHMLLIACQDRVCPVLLDPVKKTLMPLEWSKIWHGIDSYAELMRMAKPEINELRFLEREF
jgi:hypothetical protein